MGDHKDSTEDDNVWQHLLQKSMTRSRESNSTMIVLGHKNNGKTSMLRQFDNRFTNPSTAEYLLDYSYLHVTNRHNADRDEVLAHMNIWQMDELSHGGLLSSLIQSEGLERTCFIVTLDLSKPWDLVSSLEAWLEVVSNAAQAALQNLDEKHQTELKDKLSRYVQLYVDPSIANTDGKATTVIPSGNDKIELNPNVPAVNLGVPIIIVGCKADALSGLLVKESSKTLDAGSSVSQAEANAKFDVISSALRKISLQYGAGLVFTSAAGQRGNNITTLQDYIFHRLYSFPLTTPATVTSSTEDFGLYIPSGFDSLDLIESLAPSLPSLSSSSYQEIFPNPQQQKKKVRVQATVKAQNNALFFKTLQYKLVDSERKSFSSTSTSSSSSLSTSSNPSSANTKKTSSTSRSSSSPSKPSSTSRSSSGTKPKAGAKRQVAVKQFFRSLLDTNGPSTSSSSIPKELRSNAVKALKGMKPGSSSDATNTLRKKLQRPPQP